MNSNDKKFQGEKSNEKGVEGSQKRKSEFSVCQKFNP